MLNENERAFTEELEAPGFDVRNEHFSKLFKQMVISREKYLKIRIFRDFPCHQIKDGNICKFLVEFSFECLAFDLNDRQKQELTKTSGKAPDTLFYII